MREEGMSREGEDFLDSSSPGQFTSSHFEEMLRLGTNCENIFGKQIGNVFVFTICFDVGLCCFVLKMTTNLEITYEPI
jgi:hypothetical protein